MKVVFLYPGFESLGIEYLSAALRRCGHETALVFDPQLFADAFLRNRTLAAVFSQRRQVLEEVAALRPDLIAFSLVTDDLPWFGPMVRDIKRRLDVPVVIGGHHVTAVPAVVQRYPQVDFGMIGEGEAALCELTDALAAGRDPRPIANLVFRRDGRLHVNPPRPLEQDLDRLPFPDKELYRNTALNDHQVYTTMSSRGCPFSCTFCSNDVTRRLYPGQRTVRQRSVSHLLGELRLAKQAYAPRLVFFYDELFGLQLPWLEEFAARYPAEIGLPYQTFTHPSLATPRRVALLAASGCAVVEMGVQTLSPDLRRRILHRRESNEEIARAIHLLQQAGIHVSALNIVNLPGETEADLLAMARFYLDHPPDSNKLFWLTYYPQTAIVDIAVREGALPESEAAAIHGGVFSRQAPLTSGGYRAPRSKRQFAALFLLLQLLPRTWSARMIAGRWHRALPPLLVGSLAYLLARLVHRQAGTGCHRATLDEYLRRYARYTKTIAAGWLPWRGARPRAPNRSACP